MAKNGQQLGQSGDKRNSGGLGGQTLPPPNDYQPGTPGQEGAQSPEGEVVPFSLDEFAALTGAQQGQSGGGQFSGEDLEFESFMFDSGDLEGVQLERQSGADEGVESLVAMVQHSAAEVSALKDAQDKSPTSMAA